MYYNTLYPTQKPADHAAYLNKLKANLVESGRQEALQKMLVASKRASEERLPRVKAPATVIMGSKDPDFKNPEADAKLVADSLYTTYTLIPGAGHYPHAEMPEITGKIILNFLQNLPVVQERIYA